MIQKLGACLFTALLAGSTVTAKPDQLSEQVGTQPLQPEKYLAEASRFATRLLTRNHYKKTQLDDSLSSEILDQYIESLDPNRIFFLQSDIERFEAYRHTLDNAFAEQDLRPAFEIFNVYTNRVEQRVDRALALLPTEFNFEVDESLELDRSEAPWAQSEQQLDDIWRRRVKNDVLRLRLTDKADEKTVETLTNRYEGLQRRVSQLDSEDVFQYYMNAFAYSIEPHTGYMAPRISENFQIQMRLSLEGIGAVLERENEYTTVRRVVPGGPAARDGRLKEGDRIVGVTQGSGDEQAIDVIGWRLDDVVEKIRGKMGTMVHLDVIPVDAKLDSKAVTIDLLRDKVKLEEQAAQKSIYQLDVGGTDYKIGVIDLPAFYLDFAARARRDPNYRSSTSDVRKLLNELRAADVDGVIVDLRSNGGGSLAEATTLTGLFIDTGPVVQVKDARGRVEPEVDRDAGVEWDGPLAVLVNRHSASASEIFAAAIQDYERGLIIGERTFGKGTVQNLIDLDASRGNSEARYGQLKLTVAQFFRVSGGSTQHRGVIPDISFPTQRDADQFGESSLDNALPWSSIKKATGFRLHGDMSSIVPMLSRRSVERISQDTEFQYLLEDIGNYREAREQTEVSLLESARRSKQATEEAQREARKAARAAVTGHGDDIALLHSDRDRFESDTTATAIAENSATAAPTVDDPDPAEPADDKDDEADSDDRDTLLNETIRIIGDMISLDDPARRTAFLETDRQQRIQ